LERLPVSGFVGPSEGVIAGERAVPMSKQAEYRKNAAGAIDLAHRAKTPAEQAHLIALAEKWLDLAEAVDARAERQTRRVPHSVQPRPTH
jgi:hypothetical protein